MRKFGFKVPSEKSTRAVMARWVDMNNYESEFVPFACASQKGPVVKAKPMAYVRDIGKHVENHLDMLNK